MAKDKSKFVCQECGFESLRWLGKCPECGNWNSFVEEIEKREKKRDPKTEARGPEPLSSVEPLALERLDLGFQELNRVLGGGLVPGTIVLLAGDPGIGKSTLLLQAAYYAGERLPQVLYISGEESTQQLRMRASRLGLVSDNLLVWAETDLEEIEKEIRRLKPSLVIVDSIQTVYLNELSSTPGSVSQIRECAARLLHVAKGLNVPVIIVGHVTKDGNIAGPRVLEHIVDTVLYFEGERQYQYRILRSIKNRFGSTYELGVFEMKNEGLAEILNPSLAFLAERSLNVPGSAVTSCLEGTRPLLLEIQALVSQSSFGQPRRMAAGTDYNRLNLILAVLEKRVGLNFANQDAYVNITGGLKVQEPAADLAIAAALASSLKNRPCVQDLVIMGEVGLTGEVRGIPQTRKRVQEAKKLGFKRCLLPSLTGETEKPDGIELIEARSLEEALEVALL